MNVVAAARALGLGRLVYKAWHRPVEAVGRVRQVGISRSLTLWRSRAAMREAAARLPASAGAPRGDVSICFLTGHGFWEQTVFCAWSLMDCTGRSFPWTIFDDGTLRPAEAAVIRRVLGSHVRFVDRRTCESMLERTLPAARFGTLRQRRLIYPNLRKLIDIHPIDDEPKLVLDSDMLFFQPPTRLLEWLDAPDVPIVMEDCVQSYGHPTEALAALAGAAVPARVNVGVCGMPARHLDLDALERWLVALHARGATYFDEQALVALMLAGRRHIMLPPEYRCCDTPGAVSKVDSVLKHYVASAKESYFVHEWRSRTGQAAAA